MGKIVKHMRVYSFEADEPVAPSEKNLVCELFYNERGQEVKEESNVERIQYYYETDGGSLIRGTYDYPDGARWTLEYTYDLDGNLVHCHWTGEGVYDDLYGGYVFLPTDDYADKWCDWSSDGKLCTWKKETHYRDGSIRRETTREEYDDRGLLRLVHHYDDESNYDSLERLYYDAGGELTRKSTRSVFKTKEGKQRQIRSRERHVGGRKVSESIFGVNHEGKAFRNDFIYEYEGDGEGNWVVSRRICKGKLQLTVLREIDYW